jgi:hypothetical protein
LVSKEPIWGINNPFLLLKWNHSNTTKLNMLFWLIESCIFTFLTKTKFKKPLKILNEAAPFLFFEQVLAQPFDMGFQKRAVLASVLIP